MVQRRVEETELARTAHIRQQDEHDARKLIGTPVTVESFLAWAAEFNAAIDRERTAKKMKEAKKRPTGEYYGMRMGHYIWACRQRAVPVRTRCRRRLGECGGHRRCGH